MGVEQWSDRRTADPHRPYPDPLPPPPPLPLRTRAILDGKEAVRLEAKSRLSSPPAQADNVDAGGLPDLKAIE
jgi:hypothetical protein